MYADKHTGHCPIFSSLAKNETYRWQAGFPFSLHLFGCRRSSLKMGKMPVFFTRWCRMSPLKAQRAVNGDIITKGGEQHSSQSKISIPDRNKQPFC